MDPSTELNRFQENVDGFEEDELFVDALEERLDAFDEALLNLNELSDVNALRILGYAVENGERDPGAVTT